VAKPVNMAMTWRMLVEKQMRPDFIVIDSIGRKEPAQRRTKAEVGQHLRIYEFTPSSISTYIARVSS